MLLCCFCARYRPLIFSVVENAIYDTLLRHRNHPAPTGKVVLVDVDDQSLKAFGQWPWPRYRMAVLVRSIKDFGAACIGMDIIFSEPDRTSLARLALRLQNELGVELSFCGIKEKFLDNDQTFARALQEATVVLGYTETFDGSGGKTIPDVQMVVRRKPGVGDGWGDIQRSDSAILPLPVLAENSSGLGFVNSIPDRDGILRRIPMVMLHDGHLVLSLPLACYLRTLDHPGTLEIDHSGEMDLHFGENAIALDKQGNMLIPYSGGQNFFPRYSAKDILDGNVSPDALKNRIVIVGTSASGLRELRVTPFDADYPGAEVHATVIDSIIRGESILHPSWVQGLEQLSTVVSGLILSFFLTCAGAIASLVILVTVISGFLLTSYWAMAHGIFFSPLYPVLVCIMVFSFLSLLKFWREEREGIQRLKELSMVQEVMMETMANVTETRDAGTGGHIRRTQNYVVALVEGMRIRPAFAPFLDKEFAEQLRRSAPLHDIGKVGVPDQILFNPGRLSPEEFNEVKKHTVYGRRIIEEAEKRLGRNSFLKIAGEMAGSHHEKWDGSGYPDGLSGTDIPLSGRIMAIADVYDALISMRPYKKQFTHEKTVKIIREGRGTHFDPEITDVFLEIHERFREIAITHADSDEEREFLAAGRTMRS